MGPGWRRVNSIVHRYLGYACVGLTLVYAVSGVALNHARDFNPDYVVVERSMPLDPPGGGTGPAYFRSLGERAGLAGRLRGVIPAGDRAWELVFDGATVSVDLAGKRMVVREKRPRPLLRRLDFLHLNQPQAAWTMLADLYCISLVVLAVSGLLVRPGALLGPGGIVVLLGILAPLAFVWFYYR